MGLVTPLAAGRRGKFRGYLSVYQFSSVQFSHSVMSDSVTQWTAARLHVHHQLLEFTQTHVH